MSESLTAIFRRTVRDFGNRPAVAGPNRTISYAELDSISDGIAGSLRKIGIRPGARVGILRRKSIETVAGIYGALKAGCAYVPIDSKMGIDRLAAVLNDAGLAALIIEPLLMPKFQELIAKNLTPRLANAASYGEILRFSNPAEELSPVNDLAYILYTSGSTGIPKGVQHSHASALAFVSWATTEFALSCSDRLSCHAPFHFDLTTFDLFCAAMAGACVVLIPDEVVMFPGQVASLIEKEAITVWYSVPFALIQMVERGNLAGRRQALREVIFAGERFPPAQLRRLAATLPEVELTNLFGPTETNVCTYHRLSPDDLASDEFCPIGRPCPYASVVVIDADGNEAGAGEMGELLVGGSSLMAGYLNRPELNKNVFVTRPTSGRPERFFRTGDLVTAPAGGPIRFHGRVDRQVKVRGFRIELDEIESALANCAGVVAAAAWVKNDSNGFAEVRAAVAAGSASAGLTGDDLIVQVRGALAQAAVPAQVLVLNDLPRSVNGKIDYAALAASAR
jgi:amino acid adenylation domain-containing protein